MTKEQLTKLKADKKLVIGCRDVIDHMEPHMIVFAVNQEATEQLTKHLIALCKQKKIRLLILPKF